MKQRMKRLLALCMSVAVAAAPSTSGITVFADNVECAEVEEVLEIEEKTEEETEEGTEVFYEESEETGQEETDFSSGEIQELDEEYEIILEEEDSAMASYAAENLVMNPMAASVTEVGQVYSIKASYVTYKNNAASGMYAMDNESLVLTQLSDGTYLVRMHQTSKNRNLLAVVGAELMAGEEVDAINTSVVNIATAHQIPWYLGNGADGYWFTIPVADIEEPLYFCMSDESRIESGKSFGNVVKCVFDLTSMSKSTETAPSRADMNILPVPVPATDMKLEDNSAKTIWVGDEVELKAVLTPENSTDKVTFKSSDEKVATVDAFGKVKGVADGKVTITANVGTFTDTCEVTVKGEFGFSITPCLYRNENGVESAPQDPQNVTATLTDEKGNVITLTQDGNLFKAEKLDALKEYTLSVSRKDCYALNRINGQKITYEYAGSWNYTTKITKDNANANISVFFKTDPLIAALKRVPGDMSFYEETSVKNVTAAVQAADVNSMDFAKRDAQGENIEQAIRGLKIKADGKYAATAEAGKSNAGFGAFDVVILVEEGQMKAQFTCTQTVYKKVFLGTKKQANKASDDDPRMCIGTELETKDAQGKSYYRFTVPIDALNTEISLAVSSGSRWIDGKVLIFSAANLSNGLILEQKNVTLHSGKSTGLTAKVAASYSNQNVTWTSSDESVAVVKNGIVTAVADGNAIITAAVGDFTAECKVSVHTAKVVKLPAVNATIYKSGLTAGEKCSVCQEILVAQKTIPMLVRVTSVKVNSATSVKIAAGKKVQLSVNVAPANAANKNVTWKSSNPKVATVDAKGLVTMGKKAGGKSVVITATAKDGSKVYGQIKLTCMKGAVKKIAISGKKTVKAGKTLQLKAKVTASSKANKTVKWSSNNTNLATVSSKGKVTTFKGKKGTVTITAQSLDGTNKKKTFKIKIK